MTDIFKPINDDRHGAPGASSDLHAPTPTPASTDAGRTLVYSRLPDDQKERLHLQVRTLVESRVNELRGRFNL
jgi:hypothetical protein